jgi:hypothetical protein
MVVDGVGGFSKANDGKFPQNIESIIPYLPQGFDSSIARRFTINTDGEDTGGRPKKWQVIETGLGLVDDLWDEGRAFFNVQDLSAMSGVSWGNSESENIVRDAIAKYENEHGAAPSDINQITKYIDNTKIDNTKAGEIYKSIMIPIQ